MNLERFVEYRLPVHENFIPVSLVANIEDTCIARKASAVLDIQFPGFGVFFACAW
jgi:hypothetical protein